MHPLLPRWNTTVTVLLLALSLGGCASTSGGETMVAGDAPPIHVMSFNIRYGTARDGPDAWALRRGMLLRTIAEYNPVVLGVQEALRFQLDEIRQSGAHLGEVGVGRDDGVTAGEYSAILYDTRRLRLLEEGTFWLSDSPEVPGSMTWGNRITRIATWARFHDTAAGRSFYVFNTHWDHESQPARERSALLVLERMAARRARGDPVLLMGDFNAGEANPAFRTLLQSGAVPLRDTFRAVNAEARDVGTYHAFRGERTGERIDAILVSREWRVLDAAIVRVSEGGRYPSDHFPVTALVGLRR